MTNLFDQRLEALKLAYDTAHKLGSFSPSKYKLEEGASYFERDIESVFEFADRNLDYLMGRKIDWKDTSENVAV